MADFVHLHLHTEYSLLDGACRIDEVLDQVREQYVDPVTTTWFVAHGTESLWLSLANERFLEQNVYGADPQQIKQVRDMLRDEYWNRPLRSRTEAHRMIREVADRAHRMIGVKSTVIASRSFSSRTPFQMKSRSLPGWPLM